MQLALTLSIVLNVILLALIGLAVWGKHSHERAEQRRRLVDPIRSLPDEEDVLRDTVSFDRPSDPSESDIPGVPPQTTPWGHSDDGLDPEERPTSDARRLEQLAEQATDPVVARATGVDLTDHGPASLEAGGERRRAYTSHAQHKAKGEVYGDCEFCVSELGGVPTPG